MLLLTSSTTKYENGGIPQGAKPLWWGLGGAPQLPPNSPKNGGYRGLKELFSE
jgi:hypothetical protein